MVLYLLHDSMVGDGIFISFVLTGYGTLVWQKKNYSHDITTELSIPILKIKKIKKEGFFSRYNTIKTVYYTREIGGPTPYRNCPVNKCRSVGINEATQVIIYRKPFAKDNYYPTYVRTESACICFNRIPLWMIYRGNKIFFEILKNWIFFNDWWVMNTYAFFTCVYTLSWFN